MRFQAIVDSIEKSACVVSVERLDSSNYGKVCIVTGNQSYINTIEKPVGGMNMLKQKFIPNTEYTEYVEKDLNFEEACYEAAILKKCVHSYAHPTRYDIWFDMSFVPLYSDDGNVCYCLYIVDVDLKPDAKRMATPSGNIASYVLETCIKLQNPDNFQEAMKEVCSDIRDLCESEHCCILLMDTTNRKCSVLCEAFSKDTKLLPMDKYVDDAFYDIAYSWLDTLAGSNCLIIKNERDMEIVRERNPIWHNSITSAGGKTIVLFPLMFKNELLGYIWAINFSDDIVSTIKETLELTTFILASELYSYKMIEHLKYISYTDALTKLPNRFASADYVSDLIKRGEKFTVVSIDINHFKSVNDTMGFKAGNQVLIDISKRWKAISDNSGSESVDYITRINGDEFLLVIYGYSSEDVLRKEIVRYVNALSDHLTVNDCDIYITASFGYAEYPTDADTSDALLSHANLAMNEIKRANSSDIILKYSPDILKNDRTLEIENLIRKALNKETIYFNLQPQFDMEHKLRGFEALARMKDSDGNFISPGEFIPVAEKVGLIDKVDSMVFRKATEFFSSLIKKTGLDLTLSLNASARHLMKNGFIEEIRNLLDNSGISSLQLEIEITESILIDSADKALECINTLKEMGVKIAIDDFGTGYSSLSYLSRIPANLLKIDKSFIDRINTNESSKQYVAAIISMGHIMGLDVISEGVEEQEQIAALRSIGCDYIQGFVWGRPMSAEDAEKLVIDMLS
ncbi:bifunctional diguanylate cyclase/phosphodiesterase [Ruminococcus sp.]|uniref:putative bifunctional diguanylate cyclase/phosphodiesterase n=1 Tax=Ruminococcus sp. TaxID=41978 RepID=UPI0025D48FAB|nr:bifunctional diguanylate cyclase/phosphodiesterase [Ruminococcus sp.]